MSRGREFLEQAREHDFAAAALLDQPRHRLDGDSGFARLELCIGHPLMGADGPSRVVAQHHEGRPLGADEARRPFQAPDDDFVDLLRGRRQQLAGHIADERFGVDTLPERPLGRDVHRDVSGRRLGLDDLAGIGVAHSGDSSLEPHVVAFGMALAQQDGLSIGAGSDTVAGRLGPGEVVRVHPRERRLRQQLLGLVAENRPNVRRDVGVPAAAGCGPDDELVRVVARGPGPGVAVLRGPASPLSPAAAVWCSVVPPDPLAPRAVRSSTG